MTTATAVMLSGPIGAKGQPQLALVLLEGGRPAGGFQSGKAIDAAEAAALLSSPTWRARE